MKRIPIPIYRYCYPFIGIAGRNFPQEPGNQVPRKFFHWQEILDEIPCFWKEILVQIHAHLKGTMSSDIIFFSSHSLNLGHPSVKIFWLVFNVDKYSFVSDSASFVFISNFYLKRHYCWAFMGSVKEIRYGNKDGRDKVKW